MNTRVLPRAPLALWKAAVIGLLIALLLLLKSASADIIASYSFDNDPADIARDSGPHHLDGAVVGAGHCDGVAGTGAALRFVAGARADFPRSALYAFDHTRSFTISLWVRTQQAGFSTLLMARDLEAGGVSYSFVLGRRPGVVAFEVWSWATVKLVGTTPINDGAWHHLTGAYDAGSNLACFLVDDRLEAIMPVGPGGLREVDLRLGNNIGCDQPFVGDLDNLLIESGVPDSVRQAIGRYQHWTVLDPEEVKAAFQAYLDRMAAPKFFQAQSAEEWREHAAAVRRHVLECLNLWPLPERLPLNLHVSGTIEHEAYKLQRVYWQTWPGYYASGYLYVPKHAPLPAPAVLCPHGHWEHGARNPVVQARCISLATMGYVVLAVDSVHAYHWSAGLVPLTVMTWNNMRGLDLLCSMPEVDATRIGCTGASGGAQQTFYLMAVEDRIRCAIPVCMVSEWRRILAIDSAHCPCNHLPGILSKTDTPELAACFAPRPSLIICATGDWTAHLPEEGFPGIQRVYDLFGAGDQVRCTRYDSPHDYSKPMREEAYAWFNQHLRGIVDPAQAREPDQTPETLETLAKLDGPPVGARGTEVIVADILQREGFNPALPGPDAATRLASIRDRFAQWAHEPGLPNTTSGSFITATSGPRGESEEVEGLAVLRLVVTSDEGIPIPVVVLWKPGSAQPRPAVMLLDSGGKASLLAACWRLVQALAERGALVCVPDVRPYGELGYERAVQELNGTTFGRPELAVAAHDVTSVASYLRVQDEVLPDGIAVAAFAEAATVALAAALLDAQLTRIAALGLGDTYAANDRHPRAPRLLTVADLPQMAGAVAPRPLWLQGARQPEAFRWTSEAYGALGAASALQMTQAPPSDNDLAEWLTSP